MAEQKAEEVMPISETRGQQPEDEASKAVQPSGWDALLSVATGEM